MNKQKLSQSIVEYLIVLFFFILIILFLNNLVLSRGEKNAKTQNQEILCEQAKKNIEKLISSYGSPPNWYNDTTNVREIGLAMGNGYISLEKFNAIKGITTDRLPKLGVDPLYFYYQINGFIWINSTENALRQKTYPFVQILRGINFFYINTTKIDLPSTFQVDVLFFNTNDTAIASQTTENSDTVKKSSTAAGDKYKIILNISSSDADAVNISFTTTPEMLLINNVVCRAAQADYSCPIWLENLSLEDFVGSRSWYLTTTQTCKVRSGGILYDNNTNQTFYAKFESAAW